MWVKLYKKMAHNHLQVSLLHMNKVSTENYIYPQEPLTNKPLEFFKISHTNMKRNVYGTINI